MQRRGFLATAALLLVPVGWATRAAASVADGIDDYRERLITAAKGFRTRRASEPRELWPDAPRAKEPLRIARDQGLTLSSPDGSLTMRTGIGADGPWWSLNRGDVPLLAPGRLGFAFRDAPALGAGLLVAASRRRSVDETWTQPWGEVSEIRNRFNELVVDLAEPVAGGRRLRLELRAFDDGVAFRLVYPEQPDMPAAITEETSEFVLATPGRSRVWWLPGWGFARDEYLYRIDDFDDMLADPDARAVHTPLTIQTPQAWLCIHEAALIGYSGMNLAPQDGGILRADLVPWSDGDRVKLRGAFQTPWRAVIVASTPARLTESTMILNLNEPAAYDVGWFKPGKYVGIWWGYIINYWDRVPGPHYGATTRRMLETIDFAARYGFSVLVESWNKGWGNWREKSEISYSEPSEEYDENSVIEYAAAKGVGLVGHHETSGDIQRYVDHRDEAFGSLNRWNARFVKTGYVASQPGLLRRRANGSLAREWHYGQYMVEHQQWLTEFAAANEVAIIAHETVKDTGLRRTYPNLISRECAIGQEFNGFDVINDGTPPDHETNLVYTRLLAGPMDYTPGIFDIDLSSLTGDRGEIRREIMGRVRPNSTLARQLALYVLIYSPMQMAADFTENYEGHGAFQFIADVPVDWELSRGLDGYPGQFAVTARKDRHSADWYVGAITNSLARQIELPLAFLAEAASYEAQIYCDADDADYVTNPEAWQLLRQQVNSGSTLSLKLAPGGGAAIRLRRIQAEDA